MASSQELLLGTGTAVNAFQIQRSLRFNSADSAYLNRTLGSGDRKTWTWSGWVKRAALSNDYGGTFISCATGTSDSNSAYFWFYADAIRFQSYNTQFITTTAVYRDVSAWYHIVLAVDTTQATSSNRIKLYVNGTQVTAFSATNYPAQNTDLSINSANSHTIGLGDGVYSNFYLTNINFIDGQALTPSSFGETNADTGVWQPKAYSGTYGTNGFQLLFADNSGTTSTTLGKDTSGNGNNWTPNNFSVTAGAGNDSLVDTPTPYGTDTGAGGEVRGNYCTLNPLNNPASSTLTNGNLDVTTASSTGGRVVGTVGVSSGKWYWEITPTSVAGLSLIGIAAASRVSSDGLGDFSNDYAYQNNGNKYSNSVAAAYGASYTANDVIGVALDLDAGTLVFYKNNSSQGTAYSSISGTFVPAMSDGQNGGSSAFVCNFGQRPFAYTAPSGFKALCTQNLPTPTIGATSATQANDYFNVALYTGTGTSQNINNNLDMATNGGLVWAKPRSAVGSNVLTDSVRGVNKALFSNLTAAEDTNNRVTAFISTGFTLNNEGNDPNQNGITYDSWSWLGGGTGVSNTSGTITTTVSANTTAGFSIVTYTGNATSGASVGHGLGATPAFVIIKDRGAVSDWRAWATYFGTGRGLSLNSDTPTSSNSEIMQATPTSTLMYLLGSGYGVNNSGNTYVAYCFTAIAGYSAFGTWVGNGSADGPFIYTGFRPRYLLQKGADVTRGWNIWDTSRSPYNVVDSLLQANSSGAESTGGYNSFDLLSNGFKVRSADANWNNNGSTYIYAAFAENPFKYSLAR